MDQHVRYILPLIFSLAFAQRVPEIEYLRGVPRFNNESFMDHYFTCSTEGKILQWQVNQDIFGFIGGETTGTTITRTASNLQYIATLLSSHSSQSGLFTFDSVLIVSTTTSINVVIVVTCVNGVEFTSVTANDIATAHNEILNRISHNVFLQYLFSANIVNNSTTYFYLCGVNDIFQAWQTNSLPYLFTNTDAIGQSRTFLLADQTLAVQQTILMAREPYSLIAILLLTTIPDVNVTCASSQFQGMLLFSDVQSSTVTTPPPTTEGFTTPAITNDSSTSLGTIKNTEQTSYTSIIIAAVLQVIMVVVVVLAMTFIFLTWIKYLRSRKRHPVNDGIWLRCEIRGYKDSDQEEIEMEDILELERFSEIWSNVLKKVENKDEKPTRRNSLPTALEAEEYIRTRNGLPTELEAEECIRRRNSLPTALEVEEYIHRKKNES